MTPGFFQFDLRLSRRFPLGERFKLDAIADAFNLTNRLNVAAVNQLCDPGSGTTCAAGQPTAAYDARQFQFALKLNWLTHGSIRREKRGRSVCGPILLVDDVAAGNPAIWGAIAGTG